jgi:hypothetical protein
MSKSFNPLSVGSFGLLGGEEAAPAVQAPAAAAPAPTPAAAPAAPAGPTAEEQAAAKAEEDKKKKGAAKGAGGTILTGSLGVQDDQSSGKKTLLGA